jgi:hypothetical protein
MIPRCVFCRRLPIGNIAVSGFGVVRTFYGCREHWQDVTDFAKGYQRRVGIEEEAFKHLPKLKLVKTGKDEP